MTGPYHASREWYYLLTELVRHIGRDNFHELLAQCLQSVSGYDSTFIVEFHWQQRPIRIYDNLVREFREVTSDPYVHGAYLLDPFYALFCDGTRSGQFRLKEIAPEGFFQSEYYRKFYFETQLKDETGLFIPVDDDAV
ncbi:MAG: LuxR family transcriptional regulator, partial [Holophagae bacterium]|nr:LuxR family transcriptional regulator [Holophagae bacterium]